MKITASNEVLVAVFVCTARLRNISKRKVATVSYIDLVCNIEDSGVLLPTLDSKRQTIRYVMEKYFANEMMRKKAQNW